MTILQSLGCCSRYFLTVFLDSPTSIARRRRPLAASSLPILATKAASSAQKPHQVVQNFEERDFAFDGSVGELFAGGGCGGKVRSWFFVLGSSSKSKAAEEQCGGERGADRDHSNAHAGKAAQTEVSGWGFDKETRRQNDDIFSLAGGGATFLRSSIRAQCVLKRARKWQEET